MALGSITYASVTWTTGDIITEVKLDNMVANDQAYDAHAAQGVLLNNNVGYYQKDSGSTNRLVANVDGSNILQLGDINLSGAAINGVSVIRASWTPTVANLTVGNGTLVARYSRIDKSVTCHIKFILGSTSAIGSAPSFSLPFATAYSDTVAGTLVMLDTGTAANMGLVYIEAGVAGTRAIQTGASYAGLTSITATVPHTWANTDILSLVFSYECT